MTTNNDETKLDINEVKVQHRQSGSGIPVLRQFINYGINRNNAANHLPSSAPQTGLRIDTVHYNGLRWINIRHPSSAEFLWLQENFEFNALHIEDATSHLQRPKIDDYEDYLFLVLHFPVFNKIEQRSFSCELDMFVGHDYVITLSDGKLRPLERLFEQCKQNNSRCAGVLGNSPAFALYRIVDVMVDYCFPIIDKLEEKIDQIEDRIFASSSNKTIFDISLLRSDIIAIRRILKPQIAIIANLQHRRYQITNDDEDMEAYFSDVSDHIIKIWDSLEEFKDIIEGLSATYDTLSSHRLNQVLKALTIISVIMLPLTVLTGMYGMNVPLPFQESSPAFWFILSAMLIIAITMLAVFRWRRWL